MPPEPKKPIEEFLEASAQARRAEFGADPGMPNPMRARLHDEIARLARAAPPAERRSWLAMFWPQISAVTAMAVVLIAGAIMWSRTPQNRVAHADLAMSAPAQSTAASEPLDSLRSLESSPQVVAKLAQVPEQTTPGATNEHADLPSAPAAAMTRARKDEPVRAEVFAAAAPVMGGNASATAVNQQQQFSQTARGQELRDKSGPTTRILDNFQVQQDGHAIQLVDADGSTYTGKFEAAAESNARRMMKLKTAETPALPPNNELSFRASGFNNSLQKRVVFEGNYIPLPAEEKDASAGAKKSENAKQASARIVGTAKISGEAPIEVDAASVAR